MVGIIFLPRSLLVAQCEWNGEGGPERRRDRGERGFTRKRSGLRGSTLVAVGWSVRKEVVDAWRRLGHMLRWQNIRRLRNTFCNLAAWFLFPMVYAPSTTASARTEYSFSRVHNAHLDSAPVRKDDASHATQFARARGRSHTKRRYPRRAPVAGRPASPRSILPARARATRRRRQRHSALRCHRTVRITRRSMGTAGPGGDVRARGVFRRAVRCIPELRAGFVR